MAEADIKYKEKIFPILLGQIQGCLPRDVPTHTESILVVVDPKNKAELMNLLESRRAEMTPAQLTRFKKVLKKLDGM